MELGEQLAHDLGNQHPGYTPDSTTRLWERKNKERKDRGIGWPSCVAIQTAGCTSCAACPHFGKIKSPLNLSAPITTVAASGAPVFLPSTDMLRLPDGYAVDTAGDICLITAGKP